MRPHALSCQKVAICCRSISADLDMIQIAIYQRRQPLPIQLSLITSQPTSIQSVPGRHIAAGMVCIITYLAVWAMCPCKRLPSCLVCVCGLSAICWNH